MNRILFKRFLVFLTVILTVAVMTFALTACSFATTDGGKDNTSNVTDDDKDNTGEVTDDGNGDVDAGGNEGGNDEGGADGDETTPEEPENPEEPVEPADPEEPEPEPTPEPEPDPEDPDEDTAPADITEVETIDELLLFADEATALFNERYLADVVKLIGKTASVDNIVDGTIKWRINAEGNTVSSLQVSFYYDKNGSIYLQVGNLQISDLSTINGVINNDLENIDIELELLNIGGASLNTIESNAELGNLVINVVNGTDTTTQNEGDIWCSIGSPTPSGGKYYSTITVYQINDEYVLKYQLKAEAPTVKPDDIIQSINDAKTIGTPTCETMYTFTGIVIE